MSDTMKDLEPYENTLTIDELRREVRSLWDAGRALDQALIDLPEVAPIETLPFFMHAAMHQPKEGPDYWNIGKQLQREHDGIPFKTEYEFAAGLWKIIRDGILASREVK